VLWTYNKVITIIYYCIVFIFYNEISVKQPIKSPTFPMAQLRHLQTGMDATVGVEQCRIYKCGAPVVTSFVLHFLQFSYALVWMSLQNVTPYNSKRFVVCGGQSCARKQEYCPEPETNTFQNVGSKFVGPCSAKQSQHSLCTVTEYLLRMLYN